MLVIWLRVWRRPELGPPAERVPWPERWAALRGVIPVMLIALIVVGGIYGGVFTPTESAAVGVVATLAVGFVRRSLSLRQLREAVEATAETTAMIFVILLGAAVFNAFLALTQAPDLLALWISEQDLPPYAILVVLLVTYIVLGAVMDELAMILLTLPIFFPVVMALDFGLDTSEETAIWFGILVLIVVGIGLTTPPIGLNVFVVSGLTRDVPMGRIFRGVLPFLAADIVKLGICVVFPSLSLLLVRMLS
jgi:tripartite ATP-independent transporter DctM subunit